MHVSTRMRSPVGLDNEGTQAHQVHAVGIDEVRHEPRLGGKVFRRRLGEEVDRERHHELDHSRDADVADDPGHLPESTPGRRYLLRVNATARADLVCEGGGVRGIGLVGAVHALAAAGYEFPRVAGSSAGAVVASMVAALQAAGEPLSRLDELAQSIDYSKFADPTLLGSDTNRRPGAVTRRTGWAVSGRLSGEPADRAAG